MKRVKKEERKNEGGRRERRTLRLLVTHTYTRTQKGFSFVRLDEDEDEEEEKAWLRRGVYPLDLLGPSDIFPLSFSPC